MFEFVVVISCLALNALLSCVEMAFVTVSKPQLKKLAQEGDSRAQRILTYKMNPERILSVLQIGITLVGAISAAVGGAGAEESLSPFFEQKLGLSEEVSEALAIASVVIPLSFLSVVIGELVPKTLALRMPMRFAKVGAQFLPVLDKGFSPIVYTLEISTKLIIQLVSRKISTEQVIDTGEGIQIDNLTESHRQYVLNLISVDKRKAKDILLPWSLATKVNKEAKYQEVLELIKKSGHTRLPVIEGDKPVGILHAKEFIAESEISKIDWTQLVRPILNVSSEEPILSALKTLQSHKNHMAVVYKEALPMGIITLEDIFEEVVGEIYDEDDNPQVLLSANSRIRTMNLGPKH